jgi:hypothetical protein
MLFGYPVEAIAENWFHECLFEILRTVHNHLANDLEPPSWPEIIPQEHREILRKRHGLRNRLETYKEIAARLDKNQLGELSKALEEQNQIERLLAGACNCSNINDLPEAIRQPVKDLFEFGFNLLSKLEIRDRQYEVIYNSSPYHICPFCGCEYFDAPRAPREALDHYLAESKYPFAAANLHNLVPMGHKCNSKYKLAEDILYKEDGTRRKAFYPYNLGDTKIRVSLDESDPFSGDRGIFSHSTWEINFEPDTEEVSTWDEVFKIRDRYVRDVLDVELNNWLWTFGAWCRSAQVRARSMHDVIDALQRYAKFMEDTGINDRAFLKAAVFRMLYSKCQQNNQRMIDILSGLVFGVAI